MTEPLANNVTCGKCGDEGEVAFVCSGCFKPVCEECALDDERTRRRCWMCMDWRRGRRAQQSRRPAA